MPWSCLTTRPTCRRATDLRRRAARPAQDADYHLLRLPGGQAAHYAPIGGCFSYPADIPLGDSAEPDPGGPRKMPYMCFSY